MPDIPDWLVTALGGADNALGNAGALGLGAAGLALAEKGYSDLGDVGERAFTELSGPGGLADRLSGMMEFQPYTVTSATGGQFGMSQDPSTGAMSYNLQTSPEEQAFHQQLFQDAGALFGQAAMSPQEREQEVFDRMMTAMSPQQERERLALENRLAAQGRLGVRTDMFGGTPEGLAMAKAQEEARNSAILNAMQFAGNERMQTAQLGQGMLASSYLPQSQLLNALQPGMTAAEQRRQALAQQAGTYGQTYATGLQGLLAAATGQANIAGGVGGSMLSGAMGGLFGNTTT
tara:strand:- start:5051 stop:5920 length:870 start_codon:yes stop_codon:yes gene_type:complete